MIAGNISAAVFNCRRRKESDDVLTFTDFHPDHVDDEADPETVAESTHDAFAQSLKSIYVFE